MARNGGLEFFHISRRSWDISTYVIYKWFNVWHQQIYIFLENDVYLWKYSTKSLETLYIAILRET